MRNLNRGFSIIEFMIAITLGALLVAAVIMTYLSNRTIHTVQDSLSRLQENARYVSFILAREVRMAGFSGCAQRLNIPIRNKALINTDALNFDQAVKGYTGTEGGFSPALPPNLAGRPILDSDVLEIRFGDSNGVQLRASMTRNNTAILVFERLIVQQGDPMFITDCNVGDIFIANTNPNATAITHRRSNSNADGQLSVAYTTDAQLMHFRSFAYYVAETARVNASGQPVRALIRQNSAGVAEEMAEGVEQLRILYGVDTNANSSVDRIMTAEQVQNTNNWENVVNVQMRLLMATIEEVNEKPQSYRFNEATILPEDRKLRREWPLSITIRNRGMPS